MPQIQEVFTRLQESKREVRSYNRTKKDMLAAFEEYEHIIDELKTLKAKKKQIEIGVENSLAQQTEKVERIARSIADDKQLISDLALKDLLAGDFIKVADGNGDEYEPLFGVRFRKKQ